VTPGESFDLDEVERFGDPWHGLMRGANEELPGGIVRLGEKALSMGDYYEIKIPGLPAVTTPPADAALGMTWLNYGVMAGENHFLYGRALGGRRWVWIDSSGVPCLVDLVVSSSGLSIDARQFGALDAAASPVYSAICALSSPPEDLATEAFITDIDEQGRAAVITWFTRSYSRGYKTQAVALLQITGTLGAPVISGEMKASYHFGGVLPVRGFPQSVTLRPEDKPWWAVNNSLSGRPCFGPASSQSEAATLAGWFDGTTEDIEVFSQPFPVPRIKTIWEIYCGGTLKGGNYQPVIARLLEDRMGTHDLPGPANFVPDVGLYWGSRPAADGMNNLVSVSGWYEIEVCGQTTRVSYATKWREHHGDYPWTGEFEAVEKFTFGSYTFPGATHWYNNPGCCSIPDELYGSARMANRVYGCILPPHQLMIVRSPTIGYDLTATAAPGIVRPGATYNDSSNELSYDLTTNALCFF
jgi:hypothetical protein